MYVVRKRMLYNKPHHTIYLSFYNVTGRNLFQLFLPKIERFQSESIHISLFNKWEMSEIPGFQLYHLSNVQKVF